MGLEAPARPRPGKRPAEGVTAGRDPQPLRTQESPQYRGHPRPHHGSTREQTGGRAGGAGGAAAAPASPGTRAPEKVSAGGEAAKPLSSSQGGQIPGAGGSLIPRETPADAAAYPSLAPSGFRRPDAIEDLLAWRRYCGDEVKKLGPDRWQVNGAAAIDTAELVRRTNNLRRGGGGRPFEIAGAGVASAPAAMGGGSQ